MHKSIRSFLDTSSPWFTKQLDTFCQHLRLLPVRLVYCCQRLKGVITQRWQHMPLTPVAKYQNLIVSHWYARLDASRAVWQIFVKLNEKWDKTDGTESQTHRENDEWRRPIDIQRSRVKLTYQTRIDPETDGQGHGQWAVVWADYVFMTPYNELHVGWCR